MDLINRKEFLDPISLDNINIMQDWIVEKENLLDNGDFDMDQKVTEKLLIISSKIVNDDEIGFYENNKIIILPNESQ